LVSNPGLKDGLLCLSLLLDLNIKEVNATEDSALYYRRDAQGRVRWGAAAILAVKVSDQKGGTYERIGKVAIPRRHLIGVNNEYRAVRLG